ncbi:MAG TPA: AraC family transcriptional regulator [Nitrobacter sp.]|jgi:AraC family transcriptional regulator|nr:AraC family transcriptional regulator [Nitrobacter sp.]
MSLTRKALWIIERNLGRLQTLADVAEACDVSRYHLAHAFGEATGLPVMQYLRGRRLTEAARALAGGAPDILSLALDSGYASHEAFSRAFRAQFGVTPEMVRRTATTEDIAMVKPIDIQDGKSAGLKPPRIVQGDEIMAVGLAQRHPFGNPKDIPAQWRNFMATCYAAIPNKREGIPISLSGDLDDDGNFEYICAAEVTTFGQTPRGLIEVSLPARRYLVFAHDGHISTIGATYNAIWNTGLPNSGERAANVPCIERHLPTFNPQTGMGGVEIWIPVEADEQSGH